MYSRTAQTNTKKQLTSFVNALFRTNELVEIRAIETWSEHGKQRSQPVARLWLMADEVPATYDELISLNRTANIFFGVNPRAERDGTKYGVALCRHLWVDLDKVAYCEVRENWPETLPLPTIVVNSGHGVHAYWRLATDVPINQKSRGPFESMIKRVAAELGGDATQDVSRLLRLPGFKNVKDLRNGNRSTPCHVLESDPHRIYDISTFQKWSSPETERSVPMLTTMTFGNTRDERRISGLIQYLDRQVQDRSRRDFGVVCGLLRLIPIEDIWPLVKDHSKFATHGEAYFQVTLQNALRHLSG